MVKRFLGFYLECAERIEDAVLEKLGEWEKFGRKGGSKGLANFQENQMDEEQPENSRSEYEGEEIEILKLAHLMNTFQDGDKLKTKELIAQRISSPIALLLQFVCADQKEDLWFLVTYMNHELMAVMNPNSKELWDGLEFLDYLTMYLRVAPDQIEFYHGLYLLDQIFHLINTQETNKDSAYKIDDLAKRALR